MRVQAGDHLFSGRVTAVAQPFEAGFGAALAATAVTLISARMGQRIGKGRTLVVLWGAAVLGGLIAARVGDRLLFAFDMRQAEHSPPEWLWVGLLFLAMLAAVVSLGVFHFFGLPYLLAVRLMRGEVVTGSKLAIWVAASAILGGPLLAAVWDRWLGNIGASFQGPGELTLFVGTYFSWGAGLGAYLVCRRLPRRQAFMAENRT